MVIRFEDLGVPDPKGWSKPHCKVYDYNTSAGTFYYQVRVYILCVTLKTISKVTILSTENSTIRDHTCLINCLNLK